MGIRLDGPKLQHSKGYNIVSDGIVTGAIQVPGTGQPIMLLADHQTTGGYPKLGTIIFRRYFTAWIVVSRSRDNIPANNR